MNLQENIQRIKEVMGLLKEEHNEGEFTEIFNIKPEHATGMFSDDEEPSHHWKYNQEKYQEYKKEENILKIPYKNIIFSNTEGKDIFLFNKEDKPIAYASFENFNDGLQTKLVVKSKNTDIRNLGIMLYEAIVNDLKLPIYSDYQQTEASRKKIWFELFKKYPERVVAYNIKTQKISKITNPKDNEFDPQLDNNPIYSDKKGVKINTWGEDHPDNQVIDWEPGQGTDPFMRPDINFLSKFFQEKNLNLLKFLPA